MKEFIIGLVCLIVTIILIFWTIKFAENKTIEPIRKLSFESNDEIKPYIDKFFRDLSNH